MAKTVIFDFDGTIADSIPKDAVILKIFNQIADENNFKNITLKEIENLRSVGLYESIKLLKIPLYKLPFLAKRVRKVLKVDETVVEPIKNMPQVLNNLKRQGYTLGILTSNHADTVEKFLEKHNLEVFDFVHSQTNLFGKDKSLKNLLKKYKLNKNETIYIGDEIRDIQATKKVGVSMIAVTWGYNNKMGLEKFNPQFLAETPIKLEAILNKFFA